MAMLTIPGVLSSRVFFLSLGTASAHLLTQHPEVVATRPPVSAGQAFHRTPPEHPLHVVEGRRLRARDASLLNLPTRAGQRNASLLEGHGF
jgi:hypothetical protein